MPPEPLPLESLAPLPEQNAGREAEKGHYWSKLLTGNLEQVPLVLRRKAGAGDEQEPAEVRDYRLASSINRSWVVDHKNLSREQVRANWPDLRRNMAQELGVQNDEHEVYTALSLRQAELPAREKVRQVYAGAYSAALRGEESALPEAEDERRVYDGARAEATRVRQEYMPLAEALSQGWSFLKADESSAFPLPALVAGAPGLARAVDALAEMPPAERAKVYEIARSLESTRALEEEPQSLGSAMLHSMRRGAADIRHAAVQGVGHSATALTQALGETLGSDSLQRGAAALDKRLQSLHELRRVAQGEVFPIDLGEDSSLWEQMAVDAAGAVPGAALAFSGLGGFGLLGLSGAGAAVAEARRRSPEGRQELQTAAGIVGGALQAGIYMGMSRIGAQLLSRSIGHFARAANAGAAGYAMAALKSLGALTAESAKLLLAGKSAQVAELGMQELAARVDRVASNIDWQGYGENILDIETNMREAAMNLPFILIAAGRAALHHFRAPDAILENRRLLEDWGVDEPTRQRIIEAPDLHSRTAMLREALSSSRRWGGAGFLEDCLRSLRLLNTENHAPFRDAQDVRGFLRLPSSAESFRRNELVQRDMSDPEVVKMVAERVNESRSQSLLRRKDGAEALRFLDELSQKAYGEKMPTLEEKQTAITRYREIARKPGAVLPGKFKLDGYYDPHQAKASEFVLNELTNELIALSYQYALNSESLGSVMNSYRSVDVARTQIDLKRREFVSRLCAAMAETGLNGDFRQAYEKVCTWMSKRYDARRKASSHVPLWLRQTERGELLHAYEKAHERISGKTRPELVNFYRQILGGESLGAAWLMCVPHTADFQELLSMGYSPEQAITHLLCREFGENLDSATWNPGLLSSKDVNAIDNKRRFARNQEMCNNYMRLSGYGLENSPDGNGKTLWRIMRPDGQYTPWFPSYGYVVNSLVGNARVRFMQMGGGELAANIERAYRSMTNGKRAFYAGFMYPLAPGVFTGFDHLGRVAADELRSLWMGDSTHYTMGLNYEEDKVKWSRLKGKHWLPRLKDIRDGNDSYLAYPRHVETPVTLARLRFFVYWNRLLSSGWVSPEAVGEALVQAGELKPDKLENILKKGADRKLYVKNLKDREVRRRKLRKYPDRIVPGDKPLMNADLARRMAEYNLLFMMAELPDAELPNSVREWFYSTVLGDYRTPLDTPRLRGAVRRYNRAEAGDVKDMVSRVEEIRALKDSAQGIKLAEMMRDAYQPNEARRYEQGWCFAVGGASAFRSSGQSFWNLLEDPSRGWELLPQQERATLTEALRELCGDQPPEQKLQELSDVLREYPGLRAYSSDIRHGGGIKRMVLNPVSKTDIVPRTYTLATNTLLMHPPVVKKGFTVEENAEVPAEWSADARVLPALQLLTELRRTVTASPYADDAGIWWQQERYGGVDGKRPNGLEQHWEPEPGLQGFMRFYERVDELGQLYGTRGQLNVCGVPLGGIRAGELDMSQLKHVTIYRTPLMPDQQVRLMPGEPNAANPYQRKPYVMHTADGVPLLPTRMARQASELLEALMPLNEFRNDMERLYDFQTNHRWRRRQLTSYLKDLLGRRTTTTAAWEQADEGYINNMELFMQMFQDGRLPYYLETKDPTQLNRGEALAAELGRLMLLAEFGTERDAAVENLVQFCGRLRDSREDKQLLQTALHRIVSPEPNRYKEEELPRPAEDCELDLSPEDAEYY